ncbi:glycosyltransferase [Chitinophaga sp. ysch24]|uniref:Glycosyltransferase n=2 Tax=Chitinophaga tropicalis TaxID=2683588 RepID=A0A7K1U834_9BACT|nr:glycosyltransferase [Chitinophaga tropicalis]
MAVFLYRLFDPANIGNAALYWLLMAAVIFYCLKVLHEWYHYFYISVPSAPENLSKPTVDILTTFFPGEPYEMVVETLTAIQAITYPHTTWLCDEADDPYLKEICRQLGVRHITRDNRIDAKAGNINNALQYATGELCVVLDPDHVPFPEFLDTVVPYFADPQVGFVQVVQAYSNIGDSIIAKGAAQQTFQFYGPMMMTMHSYGTVQAIGANCTFRRSALDTIGGHAPGLAEDMHTAMKLHAKGWKSVYVPVVLTLGLVPSTLPAYYKQQLKWARGTFELLVTTFPRLFRKFTWRQKLHYGTLPFHYFSGVIYLINFLVPALSLFLDIIPFRYDLVTFTITGLPFVSIIILARHFVQRWVMAEEESGFHVVGGLLLIGTWWIYILALVYTIIRKKVPYIPTPKGDGDKPGWKLFLPNALVFCITLAAIIYGLWFDWNPYSWVMAGIAAVNCLIMLFNLLAGNIREPRETLQPGTTKATFFSYYFAFKIWLWKLRHNLYVVVRKMAMPLTLIICAVAAWFLHEEAKPPVVPLRRPIVAEKVFYTGIFSPPDTSGLTSMLQVNSYNRMMGSRFNIISCYIPWGDAPQCSLPDSLMKTIYETGAIPMITWEPWTTLFKGRTSQNLLQDVILGRFDGYLGKFARQLKALDRPVFLRFAHEPGNPVYPWAAPENNMAAYVQAWRYVHDFFDNTGAHNVIWVWNPWKPETAAGYFPGRDYVDWLAVTILNYGHTYPGGEWYSFRQLYTPFHDLSLFRSGIPVMVAETGSLATEGNQELWLKEAFHDIEHTFKEVKAAVLFNSAFDRNNPDRQSLDWKLQQPAALLSAFDSMQNSKEPVNRMLSTFLHPTPTREYPVFPDTLRGSIYSKGIPWFRNSHTLTRKEVLKDFNAMKELGINTIRRYGPGIYDHNILSAAEELNINVQYGFWMPDSITPETAHRFKAIVTAAIEKKQHNKKIIGWHLGNNCWSKLKQRYVKPALLLHQDEYLLWLKDLVQHIRSIDPGRPVTLDIPADSQVNVTIKTFENAVPGIAAFGLTVPEKKHTPVIPSGNMPCFISGINADRYITMNSTKPVFISAWQDEQTKNAVSFNGLLTHKWLFKPEYFQLAHYWNKDIASYPMPVVKILRPVQITEPGTTLSYHAMIYEQGQWKLKSAVYNQLYFKWFLYKTDRWGNAFYMRLAGSGPDIDIIIPEDPELYRLYLVVSHGKYAVTTHSVLNTPWDR